MSRDVRESNVAAPESTPAVAETKTVTMTAEELEKLLADVDRQAASGATGALPPGAYRENGRVWRDVPVPAGGRVNPETGLFEQGIRMKKRPVYLVYDQSPEGLLKAQDAAYRASPQQDVYHPEYGWLRNGKKREVDVAENLGADIDDTDVTYEPIDQDDVRAGIALPPSPQQKEN